MTLKSDPNFEEKRTFCLKNYKRNLVNFNVSSGKSENLLFDGLLLEKLQKICVEKKMTYDFKSNIQRRSQNLKEVKVQRKLLTLMTSQLMRSYRDHTSQWKKT